MSPLGVENGQRTHSRSPAPAAAETQRCCLLSLLLPPCAAKRQTRALTRNHPSSVWSDNLQVAVKQTVIISEILDSRTRHLIQASLGVEDRRLH